MKRAVLGALVCVLALMAITTVALADTRPSPGPWPERSMSAGKVLL